jgi:hypothetical protein
MVVQRFKKAKYFLTVLKLKNNKYRTHPCITMRKLVHPDQRRVYCLSPISEPIVLKIQKGNCQFQELPSKVNLQLV